MLDLRQLKRKAQELHQLPISNTEEIRDKLQKLDNAFSREIKRGYQNFITIVNKVSSIKGFSAEKQILLESMKRSLESFIAEQVKNRSENKQLTKFKQGLNKVYSMLK